MAASRAIASRRLKRLRSEFYESCGEKIAVEGERFVDAELAHYHEARRVDVRIFALIVLVEPGKRRLLLL